MSRVVVPKKGRMRQVRRSLRSLIKFPKQLGAPRKRSRSVLRAGQFALTRSETPFKPWLGGQVSWSLARVRRRFGSARSLEGSPIVREIRERGYAKAEGLVDKEQIAELLSVFQKKIADQERVKEIRNPESSHPDFVGKTSISKSPSKFREALALFDDRLNPHIFEFFQSDFYVFFTEAFRIHPLPPGAKTYNGSYYSEDWHLDSFQESDTLKIFVPLHAVTEQDGPTQILDRQRSLEILRDRAHGRIRRYRPALDLAAAVDRQWARGPAWRMSWPWAALTSGLLIFSLLSLSNVSEFLYYQF